MLAIYLMDRQHLPLERTAELLAEVLDARVSTGWLCALQAEAAGKLAEFITTLKGRLGEAPVVHADETGTHVMLDKRWVHTLSTNLLTLLVVHPKRGIEALEDIGVLGDYTGTVVHDGWAPYNTFAGLTHAQCGVHLIRHLKAVGRTGEFAGWCAQMIEVLLAVKAGSEQAAAKGRRTVAPAQAKALRSRYDAILDDAAVPLDNNTAERSLRMVKLHDKVSGLFRSDDSAEAFATIRSYIQTAALNGVNRLDALHQVFTTGAWMPPATRAP